jgi:hypothetical protein
MKMSRFLVLAATAGILSAQTIGVARAVTIDLSLTATSGTSGNGSGSLTVNGPIANSGFETFSTGAHNLTALSFSLDGNTFSLGNDPLGASVTFLNGNLYSIVYGGALDNFQLDLGTGGLHYAYLDLLDGDSSAGNISATPLPPSWLMMLTALAGMGLFLHRRKQVSSAGMIPV